MSKIKIVVVEPNVPHPIEMTVDNKLEVFQKIVGGYVQCISYKGFDLWCNEEGKLEGLPLNRPLYDNEGNLFDVTAGTFFLSTADSDGDNVSLPDSEIERALKEFYQSEDDFADLVHTLAKMMR